MLKPYFTPPKMGNFNLRKDNLFRIFMIIFGTFMFAVGVNVFIVPFHLYNGGSLGIAQVMRTILIDYLHLPLKQFDVSGILYFLINVPLFMLAYRSMGRPFFIRTITCVLGQSFFLSIVKAPAIPIVDDPLTACLVGGITAGFGSGCLLRAGGCSGGTDILGIYMARKGQGYSVGKLNIAINAAIYGVCAILFDIRTMIYSIIYSTISAMIVDKVHLQNINMTAMIFTKEKDLEQVIIKRLGRGVTTWEGIGAYTQENTHVIFTVVSKYEVSRLKRIISECDEHAFVVFHEGLSISGNYERRL